MLSLSTEQVAILGFLLGPIARTFYDFCWAVHDDPDLIFDKRYLITLAASMGIALVVGVFYLPTFYGSLPEGSDAYVFTASLAQGFVLNHVINRPLDSKRSREEKEG